MAKQTRQVSIFINGKQAEGTVKNLAAAFVEANNKLGKMVIGSDEYIKQLEEVKRYNGALTEHRQRLKGIEQGWNLTKVGLDKFVGIAAGAFAVDSLLGYGKQLYGVGVQMDALDKKAKTVFGATLPQVTAEAEKNARAMGLTTSQYINAAAAIQDILIPMGFQRKEAADISTQLTNLSGALSEWTGGQVSATQVSEILSSALTGEREQLKQLGIVLQQEDINARLAEKGLDKLTGTMRQQAEAAATLELILEKSTDAQAGFANGADSAIRRQAELSAKISEIVEKLSRLLLPVFETLASAVGGVVDIIDDAVDGLTSMVGAQDKASDSTRESQREFNALIGVLQNVNSSEDARNRAISELQQKYGPYIGNVDLHKATEAQLNEVLQKGNSLFVKRIFLQSQEEELAAFAEDRLGLEERLFDLQKKRSALAQGGGFFDNANKLGELTNEAKRLEEALKVLNVREAEFVKNQEEFAKRLNILPGETADAPPIIPPVIPPGGGGKDAKKEAERLAKELEDLVRRTSETRLDLISKAQDDELAAAIRGIEKRYDAEIAKALELEKKGVTEATAQRIALEKLKQEEIGLAVEADLDKAIAEAEKIAQAESEARAKVLKEALEKDNEERIKYLEEKEEAEAEIKTFAQEALLSERELELQQLQDHYATLLAAAEKFGLDTTTLKEAYAKQQADIEKEYAEKTAKELFDIQQARLAALQSAFSAFGDFVSATFDLLGGEGEKAAAFQKVATLAKIAFDTASAISSLVAFSESNPANAVTFGAAGIAQFVAGLARILANVAQARKILSSAPAVKQKAKGRYLTVTGEDDGRTYNASVIPTPYTGLLPPHPVLFQSQATGQPVLASERGAEYFVSSESLRNPYVANLTRMIDNITTSGGGRGVAQFADGGATAPLDGRRVENSGSSTNRETMRLIEQNTAVMQALLTAVQRGIIAVVPDGTVLDIQERFEKINNGSGGYYG